MLKNNASGAGLPDTKKLFSSLAKKQTIALGVSGGVDSLALLVLTARWASMNPGAPEVWVYSVDHGLRDEAQDEVAFVLEVAQKYGFKSRGLSVGNGGQVPANQADARRARYQVLRDAMAADGAEILLTGHHADDQGETIMMRLAHGSGISGLAGMRVFSEVEGVEIFRPLLNLSRNDLSQIVALEKLDAVVDPSNTDEKYERARWRKIMPLLSELGLDAPGLSRFGARMARADAALESITRSLFGEMAGSDEFGVLFIRRSQLLQQPVEIALRLLLMLLNSASGNRGASELAQVEALIGALRSSHFRAQTLGGCCVELYEDKILVFREAGRIQAEQICLKPGEEILWDQRFTVENTEEKTIFVLRAADMTRTEAESLLGFDVRLPMSALGGAPLVIDGEKKVLALGEKVFVPCVSVRHISETKLRHKAGEIE